MTVKDTKTFLVISQRGESFYIHAKDMFRALLEYYDHKDAVSNVEILSITEVADETPGGWISTYIN